MCATPLFVHVWYMGPDPELCTERTQHYTFHHRHDTKRHHKATREECAFHPLRCTALHCAFPLSPSIGNTTSRQHARALLSCPALPIARASTDSQTPKHTSQFPHLITRSVIVVASLVKCLRTLLFWRTAPKRQRRPSDPPPSQFVQMMQTQLRVAVIGAQTMDEGKDKPYTAYRTVVNFHGQCYQRLLRYRDFYKFHIKLRMRRAPSSSIVFPKKEWTHTISLQEDVVEARQVLQLTAISMLYACVMKQLNEYMNQLMKYELTPGCYDRLLRLLKVGDYDTETKGYPVPRKGPSSVDVKGADRATVDLLRDQENEEADDRVEQFRKRQDEVAKSRRENGGATTDRIGGVATIVNTSVVYRSIASNSDTVMTEDERSANERQPQSDEEEPEDELHDREPMAPLSAQSSPQKSTKQQRHDLRASMSVPIQQQRVKKVQFQSPEQELDSPDPTASDVVKQPNDLSPERKYGPKVMKQLSNIEDMFAELDTLDGHSLPSEFHSSSAILARNRAESV